MQTFKVLVWKYGNLVIFFFSEITWFFVIFIYLFLLFGSAGSLLWHTSFSLVAIGHVGC